MAGFAGESAERVVAATVSEAATLIPPLGYAGRKNVLVDAARKVAVRASGEGLVDPRCSSPRACSELSGSPSAPARGRPLHSRVIRAGRPAWGARALAFP